ncbi:hypothetical protein CPC08DRAFT_725062 [Agrocybe pediades]|nr:hypothetical protein CPC08DRAFT_725062 [Agrocybe pediades]
METDSRYSELADLQPVGWRWDLRLCLSSRRGATASPIEHRVTAGDLRDISHSTTARGWPNPSGPVQRDAVATASTNFTGCLELGEVSSNRSDTPLPPYSSPRLPEPPIAVDEQPRLVARKRKRSDDTEEKDLIITKKAKTVDSPTTNQTSNAPPTNVTVMHRARSKRARKVQEWFYCAWVDEDRHRCTNKYTTKASLKRHENGIHKRIGYPCRVDPKCRAIFTQRSSRGIHEDRHQDIKRRFCAVEGCYDVFTDTKDRNTHYKRDHPYFRVPARKQSLNDRR